MLTLSPHLKLKRSKQGRGVALLVAIGLPATTAVIFRIQYSETTWMFRLGGVPCRRFKNRYNTSVVQLLLCSQSVGVSLTKPRNRTGLTYNTSIQDHKLKRKPQTVLAWACYAGAEKNQNLPWSGPISGNHRTLKGKVVLGSGSP